MAKSKKKLARRKPAVASTPKATAPAKRPAPVAATTSRDDGRSYVPHDTPVPAPRKMTDGPPMVGLGASAGGLEALEQFFAHMPSDSGIAFNVVTHQVPGHTSLLPEILGKSTSMRVTQMKDGQKVEPNCVYVAPPGSDVALHRGTLRLTDPPPGRGPALPIDFFFRSLAEDQQDKAIGIVLSGTGSDGACGVKAIKGESGMVMVQDPQRAKFSGMPSSAIATGLVDYVLDVPKMPERLLNYVNGPYLAVRDEAALSHNALQKIFLLLRQRIGHDFTCYKPGTVSRRVERRMAIHQSANIQDYVRLLQSRPAELDLLFQELLIGVTNFFRDREAFEALADKALPALFAERENDSSLRAWVPGCSTGEEAYSIAILMCEEMERRHKFPSVQIFATDLDPTAIDAARLGCYPEGIAVDVSPERLDRFFVREDHSFRIKKEVREMVVFAPQDVLGDPPFTKLDLLVCRNLLIYLNGEVQKRLLPMFHYALRPGGILFLGSSESVTGVEHLFTPLDKKWKVFLRKPGPPAMNHVPAPREPLAEGPPPPPTAKPTRRAEVSEPMEKALLGQFAPPSVVVNERGDIFYVHGRTGLYLEPAPGQANLNVLQMAREGLRLDLASALRKAISQKGDVVRSPIYVKTNGNTVAVKLTVRYIAEPESVRGLLSIAFESAGKPGKAARGKPAGRGAQRVRELERELASTTQVLQRTIEEVETANQELKSTNEELQSTNEELQSANEELATSREEMQSLNEELQTVNAELQTKVEGLTELNDDMKNLLNSTDIATLFLDNDLNIKRFTEQARKLMHLIPTDVGRPAGDIVSKLAYDRLVEDCREVLDTLVPREIEVQSKDGFWHLLRITPYRTADNVIDGLVITLVDINRLKSAEQAFRRLAQIVESDSDAIITRDLAGSITSWNGGAERLFGYRRDEALGRPFSMLVHVDNMEELSAVLDRVMDGEQVVNWETTRRGKDGRVVDVSITVVPIREDGGRIIGSASIARQMFAPRREEAEPIEASLAKDGSSP